jgi:hypothetical protein
MKDQKGRTQMRIPILTQTMTVRKTLWMGIAGWLLLVAQLVWGQVVGFEISGIVTPLSGARWQIGREIQFEITSPTITKHMVALTGRRVVLKMEVK